MAAVVVVRSAGAALSLSVNGTFVFIFIIRSQHLVEEGFLYQHRLCVLLLPLLLLPSSSR